MARALEGQGNALERQGLLRFARNKYMMLKAHLLNAHGSKPTFAKAMAHGNTALCLAKMGQYARSRTEYETSIKIMEKVVGPEHREMARMRNVGLVGAWMPTGARRDGQRRASGRTIESFLCSTLLCSFCFFVCFACFALAPSIAPRLAPTLIDSSVHRTWLA